MATINDNEFTISEELLRRLNLTREQMRAIREESRRVSSSFRTAEELVEELYRQAERGHGHLIDMYNNSKEFKDIILEINRLLDKRDELQESSIARESAAYDALIEKYRRLKFEQERKEQKLSENTRKTLLTSDENEKDRLIEEGRRLKEEFDRVKEEVEETKAEIDNRFSSQKVDEINQYKQELDECNNLLNQHVKSVKGIDKDYNKASLAVASYSNKLSIAFGFAKGVWEFAKKTGNYWLQVEDRSFKVARELGFTRQQALALTTAQLKVTRELAAQYGLTQEELLKFQKQYSDATGRATILTKEETSTIAAMAKYAGEGTADEWVSSFNKLGMSVQDTADMMYITQQRSKALGLNAAKTAEMVAKNVGLLNRYSFQNGVDGLTRMALKAQELKVSVESLAAGLDKFMDIEGAITNAANLQMLGGSFATVASNPMLMMAHAQMDPEAFAEDVNKMLEGLAYRDSQTGEMKIDPVNQMRLRAAAESLGQSPEEMAQRAKNLAKAQYVETDIRKNTTLSTNEEARKVEEAFIKNKAEYDSKTGQYYVNLINKNGEIEKKNVSDITSTDIATQQGLEISEENAFKDIRAIREHFDGPLYEQLEKQQKELTSTKETFKGIGEWFRASNAQFIDGIMRWFSNAFNGIGAFLAKIPTWVTFIGGAVTAGVTGALGRFGIRDILGRVIRNRGAGNVGGNAAGGKSFFSRLKNIFNKPTAQAATASNATTTTTAANASRWTKFKDFFKNLFKRGRNVSQTSNAVSAGSKVSTVSKIAGNVVGKVVMPAVAAYQAYGEFKDAGKKRDEKTRVIENSEYINETQKKIARRKYEDEATIERSKAIGGAIGTVAGALLGQGWASVATGMIGGAVGRVVGGGVGRAINYFKGDKRTEEEKQQNEIQVNWEKQKLGATGLEDPQIMEKAALATVSIHDLLVTRFNKEDGLREDGTKKSWKERGIFSLFSEGGVAKAANGMVVPGVSYTGDKVPALLNSGEVVLNTKQQEALSRRLNMSVNKPEIKPVVEKIGITPIAEKSTYGGRDNISINPADINLNVNGTIRLDGGSGNQGSIDAASLLRNPEFVRQLKDVIVSELNRNSNAGRLNKDSERNNVARQYNNAAN